VKAWEARNALLDSAKDKDEQVRFPKSHARPFVGVFQESIFERFCQLLATHTHKMASRTVVKAWEARNALLHSAKEKDKADQAKARIWP